MARAPRLANRLKIFFLMLMSSATASSFTRKGEGLHFSDFHLLMPEGS